MVNVYKPFIVFLKVIFFVTNPHLLFVTIATRQEHRFWLIFPRIWPCLVYPLAIRAPLN